jgi:tRNA-2-methylthio-N6-dimethylallyladenosine synthase
MASPRPNIFLETFGCQMNELDSELVVGQLRAMGYGFTPDRLSADVVLYNTCSVRELAEQKVWSRLGEDNLRKHERPELVVGVLGCMAERDGTDLIKRMPVVDILVGPGELDKLPGLLDNAVRTRAALARELAALSPTEPDGTRRRHVSSHEVALQGNSSRRSATLAAAQDTLELLDLSRAIAPDDHAGSAYVRITRGCNKFCTYCVVPFTRGAEVHRPPSHILDECKRLADAGVIEVTLLGQTVNHYRFEHDAAEMLDGVLQPQKGRSYQGGNGSHRRDPFAGERVTTFADLLAEIHDKVPAIQRLRFVTSYPRDFGDDVLAVMRDCPRICRYLHVPAQSGSNRILKAMNRGYTIEEYFEFLDRARAFLHQPEIGRPLTIAGDIIVGFPSESDEDFESTVQLIERARYKNCFIFKYSPRPGTIAFDKLDDDVPEAVKRRRNNHLLEVQQRVSDSVSAEFVGRTLDVFVQGLSRSESKRRGSASFSAPLALSPPPPRATPGAVSLTVSGKALTPGAQCDAGTTHVHAEPSDDVGTCSESLGPAQMSGRTEGDLIVLFNCPRRVTPDDLTGTIVKVRVDLHRPLALLGSVVE